MTVQFKHFRNHIWDFDSGWNTDPRGGATVVSRAISDTQVEVAIALCSGKDGFNKAIGRNVALGRLNKNPLVISVADLDELLDGNSVEHLVFWSDEGQRLLNHFSLEHVAYKAFRD